MFDKKIVLGSASPRRKQLLEQLDVKCEVRKKEVAEDYPATLSPRDVPVYLAELKAQPLIPNLEENEVLLTSDTVVILEGQILEKPANRAAAFDMLKRLSGKMNEVVTGVHLRSREDTASFYVSTQVFFKSLKTEEIEYYIEHYRPFDKAGAYGIQEWIGQIGVERISGCFYNVMGLPVQKVWEILNARFA